MAGSAGFLAKRLWNSPTFTSWASIGTRFLSFVLVLPLLLRRLEAPDIAVWWLLSTIASLQALADLGFAPTFTRLIAYAMAGAKSAGAPLPSESRISEHSEPNWSLVESIWCTMRVVYLRLTIMAVVPIGVFGTWALIEPIGQTSEPTKSWIAWLIVLVASATVLWSNAYSAYLQGVNRIALLRRWEAITGVCATLTFFIVLALGGRLLSLVIASQAWAILSAARNRQLSRAVDGGRMRRFRPGGLDRDVLRTAWPAAWRSGLGIVFSRGVLYASGFVYAQVAEAVALSTYLLAFRWIQLLTEVSMAPFYSKLPVLARLRSEGRFSDQLELGQRGMRFAHWVYAIGFVAAGSFGGPLLRLIGSHVAFPDARLWALLGVGFFVERYGAMHIQLYSTTNHIIWHWANGVTGVIYLVVSTAFLPSLGAYAFPVGVLAGYLGFYSWYAARHDYRLFGVTVLQFERTVSLAPGALVGLYAAVAFALRSRGA